MCTQSKHRTSHSNGEISVIKLLIVECGLSVWNTFDTGGVNRSARSLCPNSDAESSSVISTPNTSESSRLVPLLLTDFGGHKQCILSCLRILQEILHGCVFTTYGLVVSHW